MAKWMPEDIECLRQLLAQGFTYRQVAAHMDRTLNSVRGAAQRAGLQDPTKHRTGPPWQRDDYDTLERLLAQGLTYQQIAERMERTPDGVRGATERLGLQHPERRVAHCRRDDWHALDPLIRDCIEVEGMAGPQIVERLAALGHQVSKYGIHLRIRQAMPDLKKPLLANAARRRAKWRSIHAQRRHLRERQARQSA